MTAGEFLNFFNPRELVRICQLNKANYHFIQTKVNFKVLFEAQGFKLTPNELESVEISASMALQVAEKLINYFKLAALQKISGLK